jgi:hypothetical protein
MNKGRYVTAKAKATQDFVSKKLFSNIPSSLQWLSAVKETYPTCQRKSNRACHRSSGYPRSLPATSGWKTQRQS